MRARVLFVSLSALAIVVAACSSEKHPPAGTIGSYNPGGGTGGSGGTTDGGDAGDGAAGDSGGACTDLPSTGLLVDVQNVQGEPPAQTGGTIADGIYDISSVSIYVGTSGVAGPAGKTWQGSIRITTAQKLLERNFVERDTGTGGSTPHVESASIYVPDAGTTTQIGITCPFLQGAQPFAFTATAADLTLVDLTAKTAVVYTRH